MFNVKNLKKKYSTSTFFLEEIMPIALAHVKNAYSRLRSRKEAVLAAEKKSLVYNPMNQIYFIKKKIFYLFLAIFLFQRVAGFVLVCVQRIDNIGRDIDGGEYPRDGLFLF